MGVLILSYETIEWNYRYLYIKPKDNDFTVFEINNETISMYLIAYIPHDNI